MVPKNQKNARLLKAMFETRTIFQDSLFYDISAWTFPLAFNLDYVEDASTANLGDEVNTLQLKEGNLTDKSSYGYVMQWHEYYAPKALNLILSNDIRAKVAMSPFKINGTAYDYGTIFIPVQNQSKDAEELFVFLKEVAEKSHIQIDAISTGLTEGIDMGSRQFSTLKEPKIALIVGDGVTSSDAGEIWHLLDQRYAMRVTKIDTRTLIKTDLSRYNTIILPNSKLDSTIAKKLKSWVSEGGTLIAYENTIRWLQTNKLLKLDMKKTKLTAKNITFEQKDDFKGAQLVSGAIFEAKIDRSHPINFGYKNATLPLFKNDTIMMTPDKESYNNPIQYTKNPLLSGYISKVNLDSLANTVPFQVKRLKAGKVVLFTDNTNFRAFWYGTNKLLMNAIFFREEL
jgi:hypothetical protein